MSLLPSNLRPTFDDNVSLNLSAMIPVRQRFSRDKVDDVDAAVLAGFSRLEKVADLRAAADLHNAGNPPPPSLSPPPSAPPDR